MEFIFQYRPKVCVEIGPYGGSTTYPVARALMYTNCGVVYTIDAWDNKAALEGIDPANSCVPFWTKIDLNQIQDQFNDMLIKKGIGAICHPVKMRSELAVDMFADESIDFINIDGNFSCIGTFQDVLLYYPRVKKGGYICLVDPMNGSKNKAVSFLMRNCTWIKSLSFPQEWILFKKERENPNQLKMFTR
jgi:hypothetical protein